LHPTWSFSTFLPDWSLSLEMQFYIAFPTLMLFLQKENLIRPSMIIGVGAFILGIGLNKFLGYYEPSLLIFKLNYFITGILAFYIINFGRKVKQTIGLTVCAFILVSLDIRYKWSWPILPLLLFCFLYIGRLENISRIPNWLLRILNAKLIRFASDTSYGIYLFHGFFISASGLILANYGERLALSPSERVLLMLMFVTIFSCLTAYIVLRAVELPGIQFGKLFIQRLLPLSVSAPSCSHAIAKSVQRDMH
jgi:peptidoglycan/LPS O-acetylase OafA/YrhL